MTKLEEFEAGATAEELLAQMLTPSQVQKALVHEYKIPETKAKKIIKRAEERIMTGGELSTSQRRNQHIARLEALYRRALTAKKFGVCANLIAQLGKVNQVEGPQHIVHSGKVTVDAEFEDREEADIDYFIENGHWPEEAPKASATSTSTAGQSDPLQGLH